MDKEIPSTPVEINLSQWTKTGEGHTAESFDHADGKTMMKLYFDFVSEALIRQELRTAQAAYGMGLPTPEPGRLIRCGERLGCTFERIEHKRSFARAIADEPERMEEYAERFAAMAKRLHEMPAAASVIPSYREKLTELIQGQTHLSAKEKKTLLRFLYSVEDTGCCIHGDLHIGNVITDGKKDYFIDMGELSVGNPLFDLGASYIMSHLIPDDNCRETYHISLSQHRTFWRSFLRAYFGADTEEKLAEAEQKAKLFAVFQALILLDYDPSYTRFLHFVQGVLPEMEKRI